MSNNSDLDKNIWKAIWLIWGALAITSVWALFNGSYSTAFIGIATLAASMGPSLIPKKFGVHIPTGLVVAIVIFAFGTLFLGEYFQAYESFWWWDVWLHAGSAFGFGLIGVTVMMVMQYQDRLHASAWLLALFAFGFSVSIGVIWEIFEYAMDSNFGFNMQKSGLRDTMWDLIVDVTGAGLAALLGYRYLKTKQARGKVTGVMATVDETVEKNVHQS